MAVYKKCTFGKPQCKPHVHHENGHEHQAQLCLSLFSHVHTIGWWRSSTDFWTYSQGALSEHIFSALCCSQPHFFHETQKEDFWLIKTFTLWKGCKTTINILKPCKNFLWGIGQNWTCSYNLSLHWSVHCCNHIFELLKAGSDSYWFCELDDLILLKSESKVWFIHK